MAPSPAQLLDRLLAVVALVSQDLAAFERATGLTAARVHLLWELGRAGPCPQRTLAQALGVTPRNVTGLVDALVASGHVERRPHPTDRRATLVTPTRRGSALVRELQQGHTELGKRLFGGLTSTERRQAAELLDGTAERLAPLVTSAATVDT